MRRWLKQLFCAHATKTNRIVVSGYGYTEYEMQWCLKCEKWFIKQTREQQ